MVTLKLENNITLFNLKSQIHRVFGKEGAVLFRIVLQIM
jgi:hypothetical protein